MTGEKIEAVARALWANHHQRGLSWELYKKNHPDVVEVYRDNARVAIEVIEKLA